MDVARAVVANARTPDIALATSLNLLILTSQAQEAEALVGALRNGGLPARGVYTHRPERLAELVLQHPSDLMLCCVYDPKVDLQATLTHHKALGRDLPLVLIADAQTPTEPLIQAMQAGARDLTERGDARHLQLVVAREWSDLRNRRALIEVRAQLERCQQHRLEQRGDAADAFASVRDGFDADTGMPGRAALMQTLSERLAAADAARLALIVLRIAGLERIAEVDGPSAAFGLAARVATKLHNAVPAGGLLGRVGDGAFALAVQPVSAEQVRPIAEALHRLGGEALNQYCGGLRGIDCVTGFAMAGPDERSAAALLDKAYRATAALGASMPTPAPPPAARRDPDTSSTPGAPNEVAADTQGRAAGQAADLVLVDEALRGVGAAGLRLVYQPIVSLMGDSQENYSVLARLVGADGHIHEAKAFLGAAAAAGRLGEIDRWVIQRAIAELADQRKQGRPVNFFVNIAATSVQNEELIPWICDQLRDLDARGHWLTWQFPAEEARTNLPALARRAEGLKKIKCRIALSHCADVDILRMLTQHLPVDFLLLSRDIANGLASELAIQQRLGELVDLARSRSVRTVATGVEDRHTLTFLWSAGIDYVQGNFLEGPSPSIEVRGPG